MGWASNSPSPRPSRGEGRDEGPLSTNTEDEVSSLPRPSPRIAGAIRPLPAKSGERFRSSSAGFSSPPAGKSPSGRHRHDRLLGVEALDLPAGDTRVIGG